MILLDTCSLLWLTSDQDKLSHAAKTHISKSVGAIFVSSITAFEIGIKHRKGHLRMSKRLDEWFAEVLSSHAIGEIPVSTTIAISATTLPMIHSDPMDRLIIATSMINGLSIVSPDKTIARYPCVRVLW